MTSPLPKKAKVPLNETQERAEKLIVEEAEKQAVMAAQARKDDSCAI